MPRKKVEQFPGTPTKATANNVADLAASVSPNEQLMKIIYDLYTTKEIGIETIAKHVGLPEIIAPHKKTTILLCGNHSSGKSSFVNWYIGEHIQKTGVAMETAAFTIITSGNRRETLKGAASLEFWPRLASELKGLKGIPDYLQTEFSVSTERRFAMINFIDTPGLVDGHAEYPYPVEDILVRLAHSADLVFVFLDPMGKAGCKRTLNVAEKLVKISDLQKKIRFFLTKADTLGDAEDRQKVIVQIAQNLTSVLNTVNFELPTIFIPTDNEEHRHIPNSIHRVCKEIEDTINQSVQNAIVSLGNDSQNILTRIDKLLLEDTKKREANSSARWRSLTMVFLALAFVSLPLLFLARAVFRIAGLGELDNFGGGALFTASTALFDSLSTEYKVYGIGALLVLFLIFSSIAVLSLRRVQRVLTRQDLALLHKYSQRVQEVIGKKDEFYGMYFSAVRGDAPVTPLKAAAFNRAAAESSTL